MRALIKYKGFPSNAMNVVKKKLVYISIIPPTAPLDAPAMTEVRGICSSIGRPMNLFKFLLNRFIETCRTGHDVSFAIVKKLT